MELPEAKKLNIINQIPNEDHLRKEVLMKIFQNMNTFENVSDVHGNDELGKDIVLTEKDNFDDFIYTALIIKTGKLSNATSSGSGKKVSTIKEQIVMTINSGYNCLKTNRKVNFNKIVIITNGKISNSVQRELRNIAEKHEMNNIVFKGEYDIIKWVDELIVIELLFIYIKYILYKPIVVENAY